MAVVRRIMAFTGPQEAARGLAQTCKACATAEVGSEAYWKSILEQMYFTEQEAAAMRSDDGTRPSVRKQVAVGLGHYARASCTYDTGARTRSQSRMGMHWAMSTAADTADFEHNRALRKDTFDRHREVLFDRLVAGDPSAQADGLDRCVRVARRACASAQEGAGSGRWTRRRSALQLVAGSAAGVAHSMAGTIASDADRPAEVVRFAYAGPSFASKFGSAWNSSLSPMLSFASPIVNLILATSSGTVVLLCQAARHTEETYWACLLTAPFDHGADADDTGGPLRYARAMAQRTGVSWETNPGLIDGMRYVCSRGQALSVIPAGYILADLVRIAVIANIAAALCVAVDYARIACRWSSVPLAARVSGWSDHCLCVCWRRRPPTALGSLASQVAITVWALGMAARQWCVERWMWRSGPAWEAWAVAASLGLLSLPVALSAAAPGRATECLLAGTSCFGARGHRRTRGVKSLRVLPARLAADGDGPRTMRFRTLPLSPCGVRLASLGMACMMLLQAASLAAWRSGQDRSVDGPRREVPTATGEHWAWAWSDVLGSLAATARSLVCLGCVVGMMRDVKLPPSLLVTWIGPTWALPVMWAAGLAGLAQAALLVSGGDPWQNKHPLFMVMQAVTAWSGSVSCVLWLPASQVALVSHFCDQSEENVSVRLPVATGPGDGLVGTLTPAVLAVTTIKLGLGAHVRRWSARRPRFGGVALYGVG